MQMPHWAKRPDDALLAYRDKIDGTAGPLSASWARDMRHRITMEIHRRNLIRLKRKLRHLFDDLLAV